MHRLSRLFRRLVRPSREKLIRRQIAEFEKINPDLHKDIGLHENSFRELAERVVDQRYGPEEPRMQDDETPTGTCPEETETPPRACRAA